MPVPAAVFSHAWLISEHEQLFEENRELYKTNVVFITQFTYVSKF
jgi:hypothetical protein